MATHGHITLTSQAFDIGTLIHIMVISAKGELLRNSLAPFSYLWTYAPEVAMSYFLYKISSHIFYDTIDILPTPRT